MDKNQYSLSDAWLLLSIMLSVKEETVSLKNVIAAGDFIQHAIITRDEINSGICKLQSDGFIGYKNKIFVLTQKTKDAFKLNKRSKILSDLEKVYSKLLKNNESPLCCNSYKDQVSLEEYNFAVQDYLKQR
ncbi:MAG: hypothetical protein A2252_04185 [Elusimicrobia bacterium RIFOXYA2_FULL_39_19]|nr:MAG: hypothetical protein A2252_04185 [Elusimicrobia bacterium RIFOXYA2_FULL_39_19]